MNSKKKPSPADQADNQKRIMFVAMLLLSLIYAVKTMRYIVSEELREFLSILGNSLFGLFTVAALGMILWKFVFIPRDQQHLLYSPDSYAKEIMHRACLYSWVSTMLMLSFITLTISHEHSAFPAEFYINLTLFFMLSVFSLTFFILFRSGPEESQ